ncbi:DNA-binding protein [Paenibacillus darwinianus]|uniref:DNA-binding protein n=1 Tax=Paenibacillus darwinianus TaxID=1380763 RepID=A0A9W5S2T0_9BACL|nr:heavy-metal-associated domain-containing protein [Paenibacillus darwinianus]EXX91278.1 DNA-binding protein [Paenibacillus darwinianus]EXX91778.1 DNA-binding protein [Paenibacillus darwinianus]EXX92390.1 DNA-binding protein [Paenibacillus darwinianus]
MANGTIIIPGMGDQTDADKISRALHDTWGIRSAEVALDRKEAVVAYDELAASMRDFQQAVLDLGFEIKTGDGESIESFHDWHLEDK